MKTENLSANITTLLAQIISVHSDVEGRMEADELQEAETGLMLSADLLRIVDRNIKALEKAEAEAEALLIEAEIEENQELTES